MFENFVSVQKYKWERFKRVLKNPKSLKFRLPSIGQIKEYISRIYNSILIKVYIAEYKEPGVSFDDYIAAVESGLFYRKFFLGISDKEQGYLVRDPVPMPGLTTIGGQGSGKSTTMKGVLVTNIISSGHHSFYSLIDVSDKGMGDFSSLFTLPNVSTALFDKQKLVPAITMAFDELTKRGQVFGAIGSYDQWLAIKNEAKTIPEAKGAGSVYIYEDLLKEIWNEYKEIWQKLYSKIELSEHEKNRLLWMSDKDILNQGHKFCSNLKKVVENKDDDLIKEVEITGEAKPVAFYYLVFEEFHNVPVAPEVNFADNHSTEGTLAYQLKTIARTGRSFGMNILVSTQRAGFMEIPNDMKAGITNVMAHKVGNANDASQYNLGHAADILSSQRGRSAYEEGWIQFPFFSGSTMEKLLKKYPRKFDALMFAHSPEKIKAALQGSGSDGMVLTADLTYIVLNYPMFKPERIVRRILGLFDFELLDEKFPSMEINGIVTKDGVRYALMLLVPKQSSRGMSRAPSISDKKIAHFKKEMELVDAQKVMIISFDQIPSSLQKLVKEYGGYAADKEDLIKIGEIMDNREQTESSGMFEKLYNEIVFVKDVSANESEKSNNKGPLDDDDDFMAQFKLD